MGILMETAEVNLGTASFRSLQREAQVYGAMGAPGEFYSDALHTIAVNTRETEFGSIVEPIPIALKYRQFQAQGQINGYCPPQRLSSLITPPFAPDLAVPTTSAANKAKEEVKDVPKPTTRAPPKKKWIREYLEEEPKSPVSVRVVSVAARSNGLVRPESPAAPVAPAAPAPLAPAAASPAAPLDFAQEHSRTRTTSNNTHGSTQIPSPPSVGSNGSGSSGSGSGSAPRAGTREVHNKLEKNRRAHLKECFELLKRQLPATPDDKKTSNLSILGSAIRYIQVLRRKERECEHEMERLAREKISAQQRLAALKREVSVRAAARPLTVDSISEDKDREQQINGNVLGSSISPPPPRPLNSPPHTLNLSTKLRALPIQIAPTTSQPVVRTTYGARHSTLTLTTLAPADGTKPQNGQPLENGISNTLSTTLVHPAQIHLPLSQVVSNGSLVVGGALQLVSTGGGLRVLQAPVRTTNGITSVDSSRIPKTENGIVSPAAIATTDGSSVVVNGLTPIVVSQPAPHLLQTHTLAHKVLDSEGVQYVGGVGVVKPVVVVSTPP